MKKHYIAILVLLTGIASAQNAPLVQVQIETPSLVCNPGDCTQLHAVYNVGKGTETYAVNSIPYTPPFPFTGGTAINNSSDDVWSPIVDLPFNFCFYGQTYSQLLVGSNGLITFDIASFNQTPNVCPWNFNTTIPNASFPVKNAIYGVYQDVNISAPPVTNGNIQNVNYYLLDTGLNAAPNRVFVINFNELPQFQCNTSVGLQSSQIVMHEGTNIIEIFVKKRSACTSWNSGNGLIGLQNTGGTVATVPPGRNTGSWSANNEAWRFEPSGADIIPMLNWYVDGVAMNNNSNPLQICPTEHHEYRASISFDSCGNTYEVSDVFSDDLIAPPLPVTSPMDLQICSGVNTVNIDQNSYILEAQNLGDYLIQYYINLIDAQNSAANYITNLNNFAVSGNTTIYVRVDELTGSACYDILPFNITVIPPVDAPTGNANQDFTPGQTLADLTVSGQNIVWYDAPALGNQLALNTTLENGSTYYAAQILDGCESRNANAARLAVTTHLVLANTGFTRASFAIFPNPAKSALNITATEILKSVSIYNAVGQKVTAQFPNKSETKFDIAALQSGIYFIKIETATKQQTLKLVKE